MTAPVFYAPVAGCGVGETLTLDGAEGRHAADVRRLSAGDSIALTDGEGTMLFGKVIGARKGSLEVSVEDCIVTPPPTARFVIAQALARGGRDELAVEAMTEVGCDEVIAWSAERSVARWTDGSAIKWAAAVRSAGKQSRRGRWPTVTGALSTAELARRVEAAQVAVVLDPEGDHPLTDVALPPDGEVLVVVGPEGGISPSEQATLVAAGAVRVRLGDSILRSSTAGVAALAVLSSRSRWR